VKCPTPLRDPKLLAEIQANHDQFSRDQRAGSFSLEFHYGRDGALTIVHRGPVVRETYMGPATECLTLE
jgi:hypothetical protein